MFLINVLRFTWNKFLNLKLKSMKRQKWYRSRGGGYRRKGSYSVGYSEALAKGLVPDNGGNRKKYGDVFDKMQPAEWHHGLGGQRVYFYDFSGNAVQQ